MSDLQQEIYDFLLLHSWSNAMREFGITSKGVLKTCITRTALGYNWYPGHPGGALPYLNYAKEERLVYLIEEACRDQESPSTFEVMNLALAMRQEMIIEARNSLLKRRCLALASQLEQTSLAPTLSWLHGFNERHNLTTTSGRFVERERTLSCNKSVVLEYWLRFLPLFNRDPRLIFGADETDMRPSNHFNRRSVWNPRPNARRRGAQTHHGHVLPQRRRRQCPPIHPSQSALQAAPRLIRA